MPRIAMLEGYRGRDGLGLLAEEEAAAAKPFPWLMVGVWAAGLLALWSLADSDGITLERGQTRRRRRR